MTSAERSSVQTALRDAGLAAFVALVLFVPLMGFRTISVEGGLGLRYRWDWVLIGVGVVFAGRFLLALWVNRGGLSSIGLGLPFKGGIDDQRRNLLQTVAVAIGLIVGIGLPIVYGDNRYVVDIATSVLIYIMLGWGLNIVVGLAGLLDLGYVAFYAVGAYSYALLAIHFDLGFWICLPLAGLFACAFGVLLGFPVLRLRGDYLAIVTLGFGEIIRIILLNWYEVTRGPDGLSAIPRPTILGMEFTRRPDEGEIAFHEYFGLDYSGVHRVIFLYYIILILALITNAFVLRVRKLPVGRAWEALREDEIACRTLGINPTNTKLTAFALGATFGGFAGSFFATRQGFISPESFTFIESALILAIVVLGGMGSQIGVVLAAIVLVLLPELGREFEQYRMLLFGAAMVAIMVWRPRGLLSHREPTVRLNPIGSRAAIKAEAAEKAGP